MTTETRIGWIGSLGMHALLLLLFLILTVPPMIRETSFLEISWGASLSSETPRSSEPAPPAPARASEAPVSRPVVAKTQPAQPVVLPERRLADPMEQTLPVQRAEKIGPAGELAPLSERSGTVPAGEREPGVRSGTGERDVPGVPLPSTGEGKGPGPASSGSAVGDLAGGAPYSIEWLGGGARRMVSGALPSYPPGVNVEAQIKLLTVVLPDGSVESVQPMQKANRALEEAASREVRQWKFEPLRSYQPQVSQSCVITFQFKLR